MRTWNYRNINSRRTKTNKRYCIRKEEIRNIQIFPRGEQCPIQILDNKYLRKIILKYIKFQKV